MEKFPTLVYTLNVKQALNALIIDDEPQITKFIADVLTLERWNVIQVNTAEEGIKMLSEQQWHLIICDVRLGAINGYAVLNSFSELKSTARFILMTGHASAAGALDATAFGASDYLIKPFTHEDIFALAGSVVEESRRLHAQKFVLPAISFGEYTSDIQLIGKSPKFVECLKMVGRVSVTDFPVLITGESGTGKELVARAIHLRSKRSDKVFIPVNCGAISEELIESELFGHVKGSFTGADKERRGLWEEADGGTIFLDEITETSQLFQVKLLRALQEGEIRRVGSNQTLKVNVRVIAASNRDIKEEVQQGRFRKDLMYRLNAFTMELPPLRERVEDIALLATHFAKRIGLDKTTIEFSSSALKILEGYRWEGNIRELENTVLFAASMSDNVIYPEHLPEYIQASVEAENELSSPEHEKTLNGKNSFLGNGSEWLSLSEIETKYATEVLAYTGGNKLAAARLLQVDPKTLKRILNRSGNQ